MNVSKMYKHAMHETQNGQRYLFIEDDKYSELDWRRFAALGLGNLVPVGGDKFALAITADAFAWPILRRRTWLNTTIGFLSGVAATVIAQLIIRALTGQ